MYGAEWCGDCRRSKALLDRRGVDYDYVDLEVVIDGADRAKAISGPHPDPRGRVPRRHALHRADRRRARRASSTRPSRRRRSPARRLARYRSAGMTSDAQSSSPERSYAASGKYEMT